MVIEEEQLTGEAQPNNMTLLIDADTILYATCAVLEEETSEGYVINLDLAENTIKEKLAYMKKRTGCGSALLFFTGGRNFRFDLYPDYKGNRKEVRHPAGREELKQRLSERYSNVVIVDCWEADDAVVALKVNAPDAYLLSATDKDVLQGVAGRHYNYNKDVFITTTEERARFWPYFQCITGDPSDNIKGVPGLGPKKALQFISPEMDEQQLWRGVLSAYASKDLGEEEALLNMRMVNMLQTRTGRLVLWDPKVR